jgi:hypothetical protein
MTYRSFRESERTTRALTACPPFAEYARRSVGLHWCEESSEYPLTQTWLKHFVDLLVMPQFMDEVIYRAARGTLLSLPESLTA